MHPLSRQALSSLTLVGDLCVPVATQARMLNTGKRKTVHHHLVDYWNEMKLSSLPPHPHTLFSSQEDWLLPQELTLAGAIRYSI